MEDVAVAKTEVTSPARPNVVLIMADDMGWGDLGCYGARRIPTPNMDAVAAQGLRATDAHSASAVCTPSRYALLTGRYAWRSPLKRFVLMGHGPALIEPDRPTLASVLKGAGYRTGAFGKWHLGLGWQWKDGHRETAFGPEGRLWIGEADAGWDIDYSQPFTGGPTELGFDRFFGISGSLDMPPYCFLSQNRTVSIPDRPKEELITSQRPGLQTAGWRDDAVDVRVTAEATSWLRERADEGPFFLYLAPAAPHRPCVPPDFVRGRTGLGNRADAVCLVDWMVGEVDRTLSALGVSENTIFIVTSDNGAPMIYPEDGDTEVHLPNGPYRGQKGDIWDGGHREPLLIRWPGRIPAGSTTDALMGLVDLYATVTTAAGVPVPPGAAEDSANRLSLLTGEAPDPSPEIAVHHSLEGRFGIRMGKWKVAFCTGSGGGFSEPAGEPFDTETRVGQLYDLETDPYETQDLWDSRPDIAAEAYELLQKICLDPSSGLPFGVQLTQRSAR
jgi:arylsulfatase A-like enzyme